MIHIYPYHMSAHLRVTGEDAADFLQSQFSNDLRPFELKQVTYGLWLDLKGKVVADSWVLCEGPEAFRIFSEHCASSVIAEKLEHHIIADDVDIRMLSAAPALAIIGDEGLGLVNNYAGATILPGRRSAARSWECVFETAAARDQFLQEHAASIVSENKIQHLRLQAGVPLVPAEIGPGELPGEGGLDGDAVAFDKGCFLGQEVVARMHNVGRPTRGLYLVRGEGPPLECPQSIFSDQAKKVGELRTAYADGSDWRGVALLKLRYANAVLQLEAGAIQLESPFGKALEACDE